METTIIRDVELVSVGMEWPSANGPITFTFEHLRDAMTAANEDPHIVPPRLKIGHSDPRFADPGDPGHDPFYDGEPALGSVRNLRLVNDGATLIGDYVEVPTWLAESMPTAYPSRSIEGAWAATTGAAGEPLGTWDVTTPGGKKYSFVLTACALLGLSRPAVEDLEDLQRFVVEGKGLVVAGTAPDGGEPASATIGAVPVASRDQAAVDATASVDHVIGSFYADHGEDVNDPMYWWWVRDAWTDPNFLVLDDDDGGLWKVPFTSDDNQAVSFDDASRALQTFLDAPAEAAALSLRNGAPIRHFATAAASRAEYAVHRGGKASATLDPMFETDEKRKLAAAKLGLAEDATEEQILDALTTEDEAPEVEETVTPEVDENPEPEEDETNDEAPVLSADTVTVDKAVWEDTLSKVARLAKQDEVRLEGEREAKVEQAVAAGKILPASRKDWLAKMSAAPEATAAELDSLAAGLVPTPETERGSSAVNLGADLPTDPEAAGRAYVQQNFPHLAEEA